ncbi:MAG: hypothetical protein AB1486_27310 [Planctomycetota bacterium]
MQVPRTPLPSRAGPRLVCAKLGAAPLLLVAALLASCSTTSSVYLHPNADMSAIQRIAVLPLDNMTTDRFAGDRVREILTVELLALQAFDIVDMGEVNRVLRLRNVESTANLGPEMIKSLGEDLKVQAVILGSVMDYRERRTGTFTAPEIALALRLVDVETGIIVWSVSDARTGLDIWTRLFGVGEESQTEAVRELVRDLLPSLFEVTAS